jgi:hypothetical protein
LKDRPLPPGGRFRDDAMKLSVSSLALHGVLPYGSVRGAAGAKRAGSGDSRDRIFSPQMAAPKTNQVPRTPSAAIQAGIAIEHLSRQTSGRQDHGLRSLNADTGVERDLIRTAEARSRAQKRQQRMGRPPKLTAAQQAEARRRRAEGATLAELARSYGAGKSTISRL